MKLKSLKIIAFILIILSTLFFIWNGLTFIVKGFFRENNAININNDNRKVIVSLLEENVDCYEEIPDIKQAVRIEHLALVHKDEITVHYYDGTTFDFLINHRYDNPVILYIKNEGYNIYFHSSEFAFDLIKIIASLTVLITSIVVLIRIRKQEVIIEVSTIQSKR